MTRQRLGTLARRHWFDAFVLVFVGVGLAEAVITQSKSDGPRGPLWFDILATLAITLPFFARRRYPFYAPVLVGVVLAGSSFVDDRFVPSGLITVLVSISAFVCMGLV